METSELNSRRFTEIGWACDIGLDEVVAFDWNNRALRVVEPVRNGDYRAAVDRAIERALRLIEDAA